MALVLNNSPEERKEAVQFMGRMPYTFVNVQADVKFEQNLQKSCDVEALDTILLDREGSAIYGGYPDSVAASRRFNHVLKMMLAHEAAQSPTPRSGH